MRILFLGQHYAPEDVSGSVLAAELASDLVRRGHQVTFVTCVPSYPYGKPFPGYRNRLIQEEVIEGVRVVRVWSYLSPLKTFWRRILNFSTFSALTLLGGLRAGRPDVLVSFSPPLPLGFFAWLLARLWRRPWVLRVEDLYPEVAVSNGVLRNRLGVALLTRFARFLYRQADRVSLISDSLAKQLLDQGIPADKLNVFPVWADPEPLSNNSGGRLFREQNALNGQFIALYSGNIGETSCLENVLKAARYLQEDPRFIFMIIGEGSRRVALIETARQMKLSNVRFLPFQPRQLFGETMAAADAGLVTLNEASAAWSLPSKVFNIMAAARPVAAIAPLDSDLAHLISSAGCGSVVRPDDPKGLADLLVEWANRPDLRQALGDRGREALLECFTRQKAVDAYEDLIRSVQRENLR